MLCVWSARSPLGTLLGSGPPAGLGAPSPGLAARHRAGPHWRKPSHHHPARSSEGRRHTPGAEWKDECQRQRQGLGHALRAEQGGGGPLPPGQPNPAALT